MQTANCDSLEHTSLKTWGVRDRLNTPHGGGGGSKLGLEFAGSAEGGCHPVFVRITEPALPLPEVGVTTFPAEYDKQFILPEHFENSYYHQLKANYACLMFDAPLYPAKEYRLS